MAKFIYFVIMSLDGFIEDDNGNFDWAAPDEEVHTFVNDLVRPVGTYLYGRRMYEVMTVWETDPSLAVDAPATQDFAQIWQAADKVVYSSTLSAVSTTRTRLERVFEPETVLQMKLASKWDMAVGGPELAAQAFRAGLVDECQLIVAPVLVGTGKLALPRHHRLKLGLREERRFGNGMVFLRYDTMP